MAICLVIALAVYFKNSLKLSDLQGERVYYLDSASSQGLIAEKLSFLSFYRLKGESVRFDLEKPAKEVLEEITEMYNAEVLFVEEVDGVASYYCHTSDWTGGVRINGQAVNLHLAISKEQCAVGTPIIFGGF